MDVMHMMEARPKDIKQALLETAMVWELIASEHGPYSKSQAFRALGLPHYLNYCPCCAFTGSKTGEMDCTSCPLLALWGPALTTKFACQEGPNSPYRAWWFAYGNAARRGAAGRIARGARAAYGAYIKGEGANVATVLEVVQETKEVPMVKVVKEIKSVVLKLSKDEAETLIVVFNKIGGDPLKTRRGHVDAMRVALTNAGIEYPADPGRSIMDGWHFVA